MKLFSPELCTWEGLIAGACALLCPACNISGCNIVSYSKLSYPTVDAGLLFNHLKCYMFHLPLSSI